MTLLEFMDRFQLKNPTTVREWLDKGLIPGAILNPKTQEWDLPERAWPPYTAARAKAQNANAIRKSIVKACLQRRYVTAKLYQLSEKEFKTYIHQLAQAGIIEVIQEKRVYYYYSTPKSEEFVQSRHPEKLLAILIEAGAKGIASAALDKIL